MNKSMKNFLLIDNSNSRTKFMRVVGGCKANEILVVATAELSVSRIKEVVGNDFFAIAVISSVVPSCRELFVSALDCEVHFVSVSSPMPLLFDYPGFATLGADRIVNAVAAASMGNLPCIAVDAGTATTFDVLENRDGYAVYTGGVIAPGLSAYTDYLHERTACLPTVACESMSPPVIGKNTVEAMQAGAVYGFCGMCSGIIERIKKELGCECSVVVTGGDSALICQASPHVFREEKYLTFVGLRIIAETLI